MYRRRDFLYPHCCGFMALLINILIVTTVVNGETLVAAPSDSLPVPNPYSRDYGNLPLYLIENRGQVDKSIKYYGKSWHYGIWFTDEAIGLTLYEDREGTTAERRSDPAGGSRLAAVGSVRLLPMGMGPDCRPEPLEPKECRFSYFTGKDPEKWLTDIPAHGAIIYRGAYPGIDLKFYGVGRQMEYDVIISPGADPDRVKFRYDGARRLKITPEKELSVELPDGTEIIQKNPLVYQEIGGVRVLREGKFRLHPEISPFAYGFEIAAYDGQYPLIIDPVQFTPSHLIYSTYLGGTGIDYAQAVQLDAGGNAYIAGTTQSGDFPHDPLGSYHGGGDAYVAKLNAAGTALVYAVFLGGSNYDEGFGLAVDGSGYAYVAGTTYSNDFPTKNAFQGAGAGGADAFVAKLNQAGNDLVYSTYLGGNHDEHGYALAVDQNGNAYVTGVTYSQNFPAKNPLQPSLAGTGNAFVTKINPTGNALVYSTYLGGSVSDIGRGIAVDVNGNAYVTGETNSPNFPHYFGQTLNGGTDAFVSKISPSGSLVFSSLLGGTNDDVGRGISLLWGDYPLVAGVTKSGDFPLQKADKSYGGGSDAFVAVFHNGGNSLLYSTYLGGSGNDGAFGVTSGPGGIYVTGETRSADFPLKNAVQTMIYNGVAAFVTKIDDIGKVPRTGLIYSTFLGGAVGNSIAVNQAGNAYVAGQAYGDFPVKNPVQASHKGNGDAFVTKIVRHPSNLEGLVAFYPFDGNALDAGGRGLHATVHNATQAEGYEGQAYYFNGTSAYLEVPLDISPDQYPRITIGVWAKPDSPDPRQVLLSHDDGGFDRTLCIDDRGGGSWSIFTGSGVAGVGINLPVDTTKWTFLAAGYTNESSAYCGLWASCDSHSSGVYTGGQPGAGKKSLRIGAHPWGTDFFQGRLDNVFIFNRWLTDDELDYIREVGAEAVLSASRAGGVPPGAIELLLLN